MMLDATLGILVFGLVMVRPLISTRTCAEAWCCRTAT